MMTQVVERDERTAAVENASYRLAYMVLTYGLLISAAYRSFAYEQATWDLLGLVVVGGAIATLYQGRSRILTRRWALLAVGSMVLAAVVAGLVVLVAR